MNDQTVELLLREFRAFRDTEFREFRDEIATWKQEAGERFAKLESSVKTGIDGNGQPSRLSVAETRIRTLERARWYERGIFVAVSTGITLLFHWLPWGHK